MSGDDSRPCRVLITRFYDYSFGGIESYLNTLLPGLLACGVEPVVVTGGIVAASQRAHLDSLGVPVIEGGVLPGLGVRRDVVARLGEKRLSRAFFREVLSDRHYDAVHVNTSVPWVHHMLLEEAARAGVPARISHGHAGMSWERFPRSLAHSRCAHTMGRLATHLLACSEPAGRYLYGEGLWARRGEVVRNGIDVGAFALSKDVRRSVRGDLGTSLVVGSVTRFTEEKNVPFLLEVFAAVRGLRPGARLWLVGDGPQRQEVERRAAELGIADAVTFWGRRDDVPALLQGMDVLVMPSLWEGLPLSLLEAQASGLPCVTSQGVSAEVDVPGCPIRHLSLDEPTDTWARAVDDYAGHRNPRGPELVRSAGFDARDCAREMARRYRGLDAVVRA